MKKSFLLALFLLLTPTLAKAYDFLNPMDRDGFVLNDLDQLGVRVLPLAYSTNPFVIQGATVAIYGVLTSTMPHGSEASTGTYCLIYASNTATFGTSQELLIPELRFSTTTRNTLYVFDPPIISPDGFSANITSAMAFASVFYRYLATITPEDIWIPYDQRNQKAMSVQFYGVKAASNVVSGASRVTSAGTQVQDFVTTEKVIASTGPTLLYGLVASTGVANSGTAWVIYRSTNVTATGASLMILPPVFYHTFNGGDDVISNWRTKTIRFPWPIYCPSGLTEERGTDQERFRTLIRPARGLR